MSNYIYYLSALFIMLVAACSSDDNATTNPKPADYPTIPVQNFNSGNANAPFVIKGSEFDSTKTTEYEVHFIEKRKTTSNKSTRDIKPGGNGEKIKAEIINVTPTELTIIFPDNVDNGPVTFTYLKYETRIGTYSNTK